MSLRILPLSCLALLVSAVPATAQERVLPGEAQVVYEEYRRAEEAARREVEEKLRPIREKADAGLRPVRQRVVRRLRELQDQYTRAAKLDEAVIIRDTIRELVGIQPDPGAVRVVAADIGKSLLFDVVGAADGSVWGTEVYTSDSDLSTAAIHAGVLKPGQQGVLRVRVLPGQKRYAATSAYGVTSQAWGEWGVSFTVELAKDVVQ